MVTGTPYNQYQGIDDNSKRVVPRERAQIPQVLPKMYLYTPEGDDVERMVSGAELKALYGQEALNLIAPHANHATVLASGILGAGGKIMVKRIKPRNAQSASLIMYGIVSDGIDTKGYLRNDDGMIIRDPMNGNDPLYDDNIDTIAQYVGLTTREAYRNEDGTFEDPMHMNFKSGILINSAEGEQDLAGEAYPLFRFEALGHGKPYNSIGLRFIPLIGDDADTDLIEKAREFGYKIQLIDGTGNAVTIMKTKYSDDGVEFSLNPESVHPTFQTAIGMEDVLPDAWSTMNDDQSQFVMQCPIGKVTVFKEELTNFIVNLAAQEIMTATEENTKFALWEDFTYATTDDERYPLIDKEKFLINPFTLESSKGIGYEANRKITSISDGIVDNIGNLTDAGPSITHYLEGGTDGDVRDLRYFEETVVKEILRYQDPFDPVSIIARNPESIFVDSGYMPDTKLKFGAFIARRGDLFLLGSDYVWNEDNKTPSFGDMLSMATLLNSTYQLSPESTLFGTTTSRAAIVGGSGMLKNVNYKYRMPLTYDYIIKLIKFAGAGDGKWDGNEEFSTQPKNIISEQYDINPAVVTTPMKFKPWEIGLIIPESEDRKTWFYPAQGTIYKDTTSVLRMVIFNIAACTVVKKEDAAWRRFTGATKYTNNQLKQKVEEFISNEVNGIFNGQMIVTPEVYFTERDLLSGNTWHLRVDMYSPTMKTHQIGHISANRLEN